VGGKNASSAFGALIRQARAVLESASDGLGSKRTTPLPGNATKPGAETTLVKPGTLTGVKIKAFDGSGSAHSSEADKADAEVKKAFAADRTKKSPKETEFSSTAQRMEQGSKSISSGILRPSEADARKVSGFQDGLQNSLKPGQETEGSARKLEVSEAAMKASDRKKGGSRLDGEGTRAAGDSSTENASLIGGSVFQASATTARKAAGVTPEAGEGNSRVEGRDSKKKDKRQERIDLEVYDQRSSHASGAEKTQALPGLKGSGDASTSSKDGSDAADLVVRLHGRGGENGGNDSPSSQGAKAGPGSFADSLARELRENYNSDIVKRASVVLKDGGDGLIRLSLKPESLGAVKISLELADNRIAGHIIVESEEALRAFEKELASLEQAFRDGGFDGASLELSLSSGDSGAGSGTGHRDGAEVMKPFYSERTVAGGYGAAVARDESAGFVDAASRGNALVDMLA